jgi:hypothetical protein
MARCLLPNQADLVAGLIRENRGEGKV